jgi:hypothetical protein
MCYGTVLLCFEGNNFSNVYYERLSALFAKNERLAKHIVSLGMLKKKYSKADISFVLSELE